MSSWDPPRETSLDMTRASQPSIARDSSLEVRRESKLPLARESLLESARKSSIEATRESSLEVDLESETSMARGSSIEVCRESEHPLARESSVESARESSAEATRESSLEVALESEPSLARDSSLEVARESEPSLARESSTEASDPGGKTLRHRESQESATAAHEGLSSLQIEEEVFSSLDKSTVLFKGREKHTLTYLAVKRVAKASSSDERILRDAIYEVRMWHTLNHDFLVKFITWYETQKHIWIVSEFCPGGTLRDALVHHTLEEPCVWQIAEDLARGLNYLHNECGKVHGDLRPESVLLAENGVAKIANFSMTQYVDADDRNSDLKDTGVAGDRTTPNRIFDHIMCHSEYAAPELLKMCSSCPVSIEMTKYSDVWSLGCTLFECVMGTTPFASTTFANLKERVLEDEPVFFRDNKDSMGREVTLAPFLRKVLKKTSHERLVGNQLLEEIAAGAAVHAR